MISAWANLGLILMALIFGGIIWAILFIFGKAFFEEFLGGAYKKYKKSKEEDDDDDLYVY